MHSPASSCYPSPLSSPHPHQRSCPQDLVADCTALDPAARPDMLAVLERLRVGTGQSPPRDTLLVNPI